MQFSIELLASLATIIAAAISVLALFQSQAWLVLISLLFVGISIGAGLYARRERRLRQAASTVIEGHSIDSLNIANLRRRVNRTFVIQEAHHTVRITGQNMEITWRYSGYCRTKRETAMEFSIDSEDSTSFEQMNCVAYDLGNDPEMTHKIRPMLVGSGGISKKVSVPFLEPLQVNQAFAILLTCTLPRCLTTGFGYYASTLSFAQKRVRRCVVHLIFVGSVPRWVRVYESTVKHPAELTKTLPPAQQKQHQVEYIDVVEDRAGQSATVYAFWRDDI